MIKHVIYEQVKAILEFFLNSSLHIEDEVQQREKTKQVCRHKHFLASCKDLL